MECSRPQPQTSVLDFFTVLSVSEQLEGKGGCVSKAGKIVIFTTVLTLAASKGEARRII